MTEKLHDRLIAHQNKYKLPIKFQKPKMSVSFVIPVYNSSESIVLTVKSIEQLQHAELINEVILVNDGSNDDTPKALEKVAASSTLNVILVNNKERSYAAYSRNRGIERSTGELIFFIDSDIILPNDYIARHARIHEVNNCVTFSLRCNVEDISKAIFPINTANGDFRAKLIDRYGDLQDAPFHFSETHSLPEMCLTCAVVYRREDLIKVKGCPENFVGWGFNDTAMAAKVVALGRAVVPVLDAPVYHLEHAPRSGKTSKKWAEFARNKERYQKMLQLPTEVTFQHKIAALEC